MRMGRAKRISLALAGATAVAALGAQMPLISILSPVGPAMAQDTGHGGGHDGGSGGGDDGGGHGGGGDDGGHGGGHGGHEGDATVGGEGVPEPQTAPGGTGKGFLNPDYFRLELGLSAPSANDAYWLPPDYPSDPQVFFAPVLDRAGFASMALGRHFANDLRGEIALTGFGPSDFTGDWSYTVPASTGPHASVAGSTSSIALMAVGYYDLPSAGLGPIRPYVSAGLGVADNRMDGWSRIKPDGSDERDFQGASHVSLAWSLGTGLSVALGPIGGQPARLDIGYRYYDLGRVEGSSVPVKGEGGGRPVKPLSFDKTEQTVSVSLRIYF